MSRDYVFPVVLVVVLCVGSLFIEPFDACPPDVTAYGKCLRLVFLNSSDWSKLDLNFSAHIEIGSLFEKVNVTRGEAVTEWTYYVHKESGWYLPVGMAPKVWGDKITIRTLNQSWSWEVDPSFTVYLNVDMKNFVVDVMCVE